MENLDLDKLTARELVTILKTRTPGYNLDEVAQAAGWADYFDYTEDEALEEFLTDPSLRTTDPDYFRDFITTEKLAEATGKKLRQIQRLGPELVEKGLALRIGRNLLCHQKAISYVKHRPETRGRKKINS
jgi:hypothetical protein